MNIRSSSVLILLLLGIVIAVLAQATPLGKVFTMENRIEVLRYTLKHERESLLSYDGAFSGNFPRGLCLSPGSGLCFSRVNADGSLQLWGVTDRGPNYKAPRSAGGIKSLVFLLPDFTPSIIGLRADPGTRELLVTEQIPLRWKEGPSSGIPPPPPEGAVPEEVPLDDRLLPIDYNPRGIDPEGIACDRAGNFWICEEYRPWGFLHIPQKSIFQKLLSFC